MEKLNQNKHQNKFIDDLKDKFEVIFLMIIFVIATSSITGDVTWVG